ncbi:MAG TPA: hypothetical protein VLE53_10185 [Gemmatimonadaceae bacterium]|nr:hypothetical protein [Gemmatimonadaceae bacterium]
MSPSQALDWPFDIAILDSRVAEKGRNAMMPRFRALILVCLVSATSRAPGQQPRHADHVLGIVDFPVSCSASARIQFNDGVALLHHMTYPRAREIFEAVAVADPRCAMAHWGIAMTLFQPLWPTRPGPAELARGWAAVQRAYALRPGSERERLYVDAAAAFFREPEGSDYWLRIRRWEEAMAKTYAALPQDPEAAAFYALAHLATTPATEVTRAHADRAAELLLPLYERNPDHPGAMHYLVHANDVPGRERESLGIIRRYETIAPRNPHALHMPTHVYTRLGDWEAVIRGNLGAAEAALLHPAGDRGEFVWDEFPHAIEYLVYAHLQQGADDAAAAQLRRLEETPRLEPSFKTAFHMASTRARYALERHDWRAAGALVAREPAMLAWDRFPWPEAVTWFARAIGAARGGDLASAKASVERLNVLERAATSAGEELFARNIRILRLGAAAWLAHGMGQDTGVALLREAAALEASTPKHAVTPGPTIPAEELLGDLLMARRTPAEALPAYRRSLESYPRRFNSVLGAARAARATGDSAAARVYYGQLLELAPRSVRRAPFDEARAFMARTP